MNAKIAKTKRALLDAFCNLAKTIPPDEITVTQLCHAAGVNRTTFYRYYAIPSDVVVEAAEKITEETVYSEEKSKRTIYEYMLALCTTYYENSKLMMVYMNAGGNLMQILDRVLMQNSSNLGYMTDPANIFIAGGVGSMLMAWMLRGFSEPPENVARYLAGCISCLTTQ